MASTSADADVALALSLAEGGDVHLQQVVLDSFQSSGRSVADPTVGAAEVTPPRVHGKARAVDARDAPLAAPQFFTVNTHVTSHHASHATSHHASQP